MSHVTCHNVTNCSNPSDFEPVFSAVLMSRQPDIAVLCVDNHLVEALTVFHPSVHDVSDKQPEHERFFHLDVGSVLIDV